MCLAPVLRTFFCVVREFNALYRMALERTSFLQLNVNFHFHKEIYLSAN